MIQEEFGVFSIKQSLRGKNALIFFFLKGYCILSLGLNQIFSFGLYNESNWAMWLHKN
jgi:hypothetical protein